MDQLKRFWTKCGSSDSICANLFQTIDTEGEEKWRMSNAPAKKHPPIPKFIRLGEEMPPPTQASHRLHRLARNAPKHIGNENNLNESMQSDGKRGSFLCCADELDSLVGLGILDEDAPPPVDAWSILDERKEEGPTSSLEYSEPPTDLSSLEDNTVSESILRTLPTIGPEDSGKRRSRRRTNRSTGTVSTVESSSRVSL